MKAMTLISVLFAAVLLLGDAAPASGQTTEDVPDAHHTPEAQADGAAPSAEPGGASAAEAQNGMAGMMQMMPPEMMEMMMQMMAQASMGSGMMAQGQIPMVGGSGMCPSTMPMMQGAFVGGGMQGIPGAGVMLLGAMSPAAEEMTPERVRAFLERQLSAYGNPRLTLGDIVTAADGNVVAEIVTVDGSLVQKLAFNRYPGLFRQIP